ncbi:MAG TPA: S8 family serine peptidase [Thermoanaerobaculia bacterium]|jgi:subtilisin family serine protease|nr:S8 family serine peptidase [Thermoanaerobaculia bacterium]
MTTISFAGETERYFIATRRPVHEIGVTSLARELRDPAERRVSTFTIVNGFAANLTADEAASLRKSADVRYVERVVSRHLMASVTKPGEQMVPYGVALVNAPQTWAGRVSVAVNVAVIDSGVDHRHSELRGAWVGGYNVLDPDAEFAMDGVGHGTHVAGTIAASDNSIGVVGVASNVRLWAVKAVADDGTGTMEDVVKGLEWVLEKKKSEGGRWVVNLSLGGDEPATPEREAFARAIADGIIAVAASGNHSAGTPAPVAYPAAYPGVIAVGAVNEALEHWATSNQGPEVDFVAPGVKVISTDLHDDKFLSYIRTDENKVLVTRHLNGSKEGSITREYVDCGLGTPNDFTPAVQGKIALIQRGGDTFGEKTRRAREAGAAAVVIYNNNDTGIVWTLYSSGDPDGQNYPWPITVAMTLADGEALVAKGGGRITIGYDPDDYSAKTGTSMATPHVAGAVALLWGLAPDATPAQIYNALVSTAKDLGTAGKDDKFGYGMIDLFAAAKMLAPAAFDENPPPSGRSGRRFLRRP